MIDWSSVLVTFLTVLFSSGIVGYFIKDKLNQIDENAEAIDQTKNDIREVEGRQQNIEQWLTGENGNSQGAIARAAEERESIANKLDDIEAEIKDQNRQTRIMALHLQRMQRELTTEEMLDVEFERIDLKDDYLRGES